MWARGSTREQLLRACRDRMRGGRGAPPCKLRPTPCKEDRQAAGNGIKEHWKAHMSDTNLMQRNCNDYSLGGTVL